ncbi:EboA domain-containing protein [Microbulbifer sp.]|uniref:EboA domain-containing protein n=1 Tax=Microbulbifer sp. TaxID=1908541 RepID=UPI003F35868F
MYELPQIADYLFSLLVAQSGAESIAWLEQQKEKLPGSKSPSAFYLAFSTASRFFDKAPLSVNQQEMARANGLRPGFSPWHWNRLQTARTALLLLYPHNDPDKWLPTLAKLFETADLHEQEALYAALPVLPHPDRLKLRATEGLRTNITSVFDAVALYNPYPCEYLDEPAWNQLVLKAVFLERPLFRIYQSHKRININLAQTLVDYAHERWAAGRTVTPELWRFVGPFLREEHSSDMQRVLSEGTLLDRKAMLLACSTSSLPTARQLLAGYPEIEAEIESGELNWDGLGRQIQGARNY